MIIKQIKQETCEHNYTPKPQARGSEAIGNLQKWDTETKAARRSASPVQLVSAEGSKQFYETQQLKIRNFSKLTRNHISI